MIEFNDVHINTPRYKQLCKAWNQKDQAFLKTNETDELLAGELVDLDQRMTAYEHRYLGKFLFFVLTPGRIKLMGVQMRSLAEIEWARENVDENESRMLSKITDALSLPNRLVQVRESRLTAVERARQLFPVF